MSDDKVPATLELVSTSFAKKNTSLVSLELALKKGSKSAAAKLISIMESTQDINLQIKCAELLLKLHVQVSKELSDDQFRRILADHRFNNGAKLLVQKQDGDDDENNGEDEIPILDFDNIRNVDMD